MCLKLTFHIVTTEILVHLKFDMKHSLTKRSCVGKKLILTELTLLEATSTPRGGIQGHTERNI